MLIVPDLVPAEFNRQSHDTIKYILIGMVQSNEIKCNSLKSRVLNCDYFSEILAYFIVHLHFLAFDGSIAASSYA